MDSFIEFTSAVFLPFEHDCLEENQAVKFSTNIRKERCLERFPGVLVDEDRESSSSLLGYCVIS